MKYPPSRSVEIYYSDQVLISLVYVEIGIIIAEVYSMPEVEQMKSTLRQKALKVGADALVLLKQSESTEYVVIPNRPDAAYMTHATPVKKIDSYVLGDKIQAGSGIIGDQ